MLGDQAGGWGDEISREEREITDDMKEECGLAEQEKVGGVEEQVRRWSIKRDNQNGRSLRESCESLLL